MTVAFARRACKASAAVATAALVALAIGAAVGRFRVLPVYATGIETQVQRGSLVVVEPAAASTVQEGDAIFLTTKNHKGSIRTVVSIKDSWDRVVEVDVPNGRVEAVKLPDTVPRVSHEVPYLGWIFGLLVGPIQAAFLVINGILLVALAQRKPSPPPPPAASSGTGRRRHSRPRIRAAAAAVAMAVLASVLALLS